MVCFTPGQLVIFLYAQGLLIVFPLFLCIIHCLLNRPRVSMAYDTILLYSVESGVPVRIPMRIPMRISMRISMLHAPPVCHRVYCVAAVTLAHMPQPHYITFGNTHTHGHLHTTHTHSRSVVSTGDGWMDVHRTGWGGLCSVLQSHSKMQCGGHTPCNGCRHADTTGRATEHVFFLD